MGSAYAAGVTSVNTRTVALQSNPPTLVFDIVADATPCLRLTRVTSRSRASRVERQPEKHHHVPHQVRQQARDETAAGGAQRAPGHPAQQRHRQEERRSEWRMRE